MRTLGTSGFSYVFRTFSTQVFLNFVKINRSFALHSMYLPIFKTTWNNPQQIEFVRYLGAKEKQLIQQINFFLTSSCILYTEKLNNMYIFQPHVHNALFSNLRTNRLFPSSHGPLFQNEGRCSAFDMETIIFHSHANFHKKGCTSSRKWPTSIKYNEVDEPQ